MGEIATASEKNAAVIVVASDSSNDGYGERIQNKENRMNGWRKKNN